LARSVGSLPRSDTSGVGGEADMPRQLDRPFDPMLTVTTFAGCAAARMPAD
jgi:hypothetical protein